MPMRRSTNSLQECARRDSELGSKREKKRTSGAKPAGGTQLKILDRRSLLASSKESKSGSSIYSLKGSFRRTASGSTLNMTSSFRRSANSFTKLVSPNKEDEFDDILNQNGAKNAEFAPLSSSQKLSSLMPRGLKGTFNASARSLISRNDEDLDWDEDGEEYDMPLNYSKAEKERIIALACRELELAGF